MKTKLCSIWLAIVMMIMATMPVLAQSDVKLVLNDNDVTASAEPMIIEDRTVVPVRFVAESLNYKVDWDEATRGVTISNVVVSNTMFADSDIAYGKNGEQIKLDVALRIVNDTSMVPIRFLSEQMGLDVQWHNDTRTVFINSNASYQAALSTPTPTPTTGTNFTIELTDGSVMRGELYPDIAPISVANFVKLANDKFYDGLIFHRVIDGFMIQGGGFDMSLEQKETASIKGEFSANGVQNDLKHTRGVLSMARTNVMDSASSQFFIMHQDTPSLDGQYAAFGKVTEGLDVVDKIAKSETFSLPNGMSDVPVEPIGIKTITIK